MRTVTVVFLLGMVAGMMFQQEIIVRDLPNVPEALQSYPWE